MSKRKLDRDRAACAERLRECGKRGDPEAAAGAKNIESLLGELGEVRDDLGRARSEISLAEKRREGAQANCDDMRAKYQSLHASLIDLALAVGAYLDEPGDEAGAALQTRLDGIPIPEDRMA